MVLCLGVLGLAEGLEAQSGSKKSLLNKKHAFRVSFPVGWEVNLQQGYSDPDETDPRKQTPVTEVADESAEWNAVLFNQAQPVDRADRPFVMIFAHDKPLQSLEDARKTIERGIGENGKIVSERRAIMMNRRDGYDFVYQVGEIVTRMVCFYANGKRYCITYYDFGRNSFNRKSKAFEEVVKSFEILR